MERLFVKAWLTARQEAAALGARLRPLEEDQSLTAAHRCLSGSRESEGFSALERLGRLDLTLEALAVDRRFTALFSDQEANTALDRLIQAGYRFPKR